MTLPILYIVHFNHDYDENMISTNSARQALWEIARAFEADGDPVGPGFADEIDEIYEEQRWKGLHVSALDPETARSTQVSISLLGDICRSNHSRVEAEARIRKMLAAA